MSSTIDPVEIAKFDAMAAAWWDPDGPAAPLHRMNPCRLDYIVAQICAQCDRDHKAARPFDGLALLDVGCGGGMATEPMARLGARAVGVDASAEAIAAARAHSAIEGLPIAYRTGGAETLAAEGEGFDVILALEIIEHLTDHEAFLRPLAEMLRPGGLIILSTLNRSPASFVKAILGAEWVLGWLPRGTHDWRRFVAPDELAASASRVGLRAVDRCGMVYAPLADRWRLEPRDLSVNYLMTLVRRDA
jgi:2-polyprenyl-6-hydroxyphenyl methylase/3-demethylubiquinone-9 3-methyltransferase